MASVNFEKIEWEDFPSTETPLNADNLNRLEDAMEGIYNDFDDYIADSAELIGQILGDFAVVEAGETASQNHLSDSLIVLNNLLYKATVDITAGDSLQEGTNITRTTIADEVNTTIINNILGSFAVPEQSSIAAYNHAAGSCLIMGGKLYRATTLILSGDPIEEGVNIEQTTVDAEVRKRDIIDCVDVALSAGTGDLGTFYDSRITADHKVVGYNIVFGDPSYITSGINVITSAGEAVVNGTCTSATTATFQLAIPQ